jgi:hypothetical protein
MSGTEAGCGVKGAEPPHRIVALLDAPVVLFESIVELLVGSMSHLRTECLTDSARVRVVSIRGHLLRRRTNDREGPGDEPFGGGHVSGCTQQRVDQVSISVNRAIGGDPTPTQAQVRLSDTVGGGGG